ncbi:MAG TPA: PilZ domain-containing protein [Polyangia bacterium]|nr:PilZ domain-containing protein [Polyangia bacterium]
MNPSLKPRAGLAAEKRQSLRLDKVFPVWITSSEFGELQGVARNISAGGIFIETAEPMPLGARVHVHFAMPESDAEIVARGEVKNHYFLNYADGPRGPTTMSGMGIRFLGFESDGAESLERSLRGLRVLH